MSKWEAQLHSNNVAASREEKTYAEGVEVQSDAFGAEIGEG